MRSSRPRSLFFVFRLGSWLGCSRRPQPMGNGEKAFILGNAAIWGKDDHDPGQRFEHLCQIFYKSTSSVNTAVGNRRARYHLRDVFVMISLVAEDLDLHEALSNFYFIQTNQVEMIGAPAPHLHCLSDGAIVCDHCNTNLHSIGEFWLHLSGCFHAAKSHQRSGGRIKISTIPPVYEKMLFGFYQRYLEKVVSGAISCNQDCDEHHDWSLLIDRADTSRVARTWKDLYRQKSANKVLFSSNQSIVSRYSLQGSFTL